MYSLDTVLCVREELGYQPAQANIIVDDEDCATFTPFLLHVESTFTADWLFRPHHRSNLNNS
jgi:hypothetical protein